MSQAMYDLVMQNNEKPANKYRSTTHEERYYHIDNRATVFFRKENDGWYNSVALKHPKDNFSRKMGRNTARRKYFWETELGNPYRFICFKEPSYEYAVQVMQEELSSKEIE